MILLVSMKIFIPLLTIFIGLITGSLLFASVFNIVQGISTTVETAAAVVFSISVLGIIEGIVGNVIYDAIKDIIPFFNKDNKNRNRQSQSVESEGEAAGKANQTQKQHTNSQEQTQNVEIQDSRGKLDSFQEQNQEDGNIRTDGGVVPVDRELENFFSPFQNGGNEQEQSQSVTDNSETNIHLSTSPHSTDVGQKTEADGPLLKIYPYSHPEDPLPIHDEEYIPIFGNDGRFQLVVKWPKQLNYYWIELQTREEIDVDFSDTDDSNCRYCTDSKNPKFKLKDLCDKTGFSVVLTMNSGVDSGRIAFVPELGETKFWNIRKKHY